jgi:hypothetical protein
LAAANTNGLPKFADSSSTSETPASFWQIVLVAIVLIGLQLKRSKSGYIPIVSKNNGNLLK